MSVLSVFAAQPGRNKYFQSEEQLINRSSDHCLTSRKGSQKTRHPASQLPDIIAYPAKPDSSPLQPSTCATPPKVSRFWAAAAPDFSRCMSHSHPVCEGLETTVDLMSMYLRGVYHPGAYWMVNVKRGKTDHSPRTHSPAPNNRLNAMYHCLTGGEAPLL